MPKPRGKTRQRFGIRHKFVRRILWVCIILLVGRILYGQIGIRILRPAALRRLKLLAGESGSMGTVQFKGVGTAVINDLRIGPPLEDLDRQMLTAGRVETKFSLLSMLMFRPRFKQIVLTGVHINARYDRDIRQWNMGDLNVAQLARAGAKLPLIVLKDSEVHLYTIKDNETTPRLVVGIEASFASVPDVRGAYGFYIRVNSKLAYEGSYLRGVVRTGPTGSVVINQGRIVMGKTSFLGNIWSIEDLTAEVEYDRQQIVCKELHWRTGAAGRGSIEGVINNYKDQAEYSLRIDLDNWLLSSEPKNDALVYSKDVLELLGPGLGKFFARYCPEGMGGLDVRVSGKASDISHSTWTGDIYLEDISVCCTDFPYPLKHLTGTLKLPQSTEANDIVFENLRCSHGDVKLVISGKAFMADDEWGHDVRVFSDNMHLDETLYEALDAQQKVLWETFSPTGNAKIDFRFGCKPGGPVEEKLVVDLDGAGALYEHFPYPLENLTGRVIVDGEQVTLKNIVSRYEGDDRLITLNGSVVGITSDSPRFNMVIDANSVPIDATLRAALPEKQRRFYEHFEMDAITHSVITVFPNELGRRSVEYIAKVRIRDASMMYRGFPLPLTDVDVDAELTADVIVIKKMTARNGSGQIAVSGHIYPATERVAKPGYCLAIRADQLQLDDEWLSKLPPKAAEAATKLKPRGRINIAGDINIDSQKPDCPEFRLEIECLGNSFHLAQLPLPVENVTGRIEITTANVRLKNLRIPNIALDEHLAKVLPQDAGKAYESFSPTGVVDLTIDEAQFSTDTKDRTQIDLAGKMILVDCELGGIGRFSGMDGVLDFEGSYMTNEGLLAGSADLSASGLTIKARTLTDIQAAIVYEPEDKTFVSRDFGARLCGGRISGDAEIIQQESGQMCYYIATVFDGIEFGNLMNAGRTAQEGPMPIAAKGRLSGSLNLQGGTDRANSQKGRLSIGVRDMQLARRSFLGKILAAMQLNNPTDYIFSEMSVDAFVKGSDLVLQDVYMSGESTVLLGKGRIDMQNNALDLEFTSYGSVVTSRPSFLETLARGLGAAVIKVKVQGSVDEPRIVTTHLPGLATPFSIFGESP
ncbi:MAG: hypothetical protein J7M40_10210 [Planctomycetes bacterium]|nr:hypothetical protein [Planctomycetota bacterium]